jgi:D-glycero-D-manno-heptose 1,7-bisphosphate phosphatase
MRHTMPTNANKKLVILDRDGVINVDSGMLQQIVERFEIDPADTPMVGDSLRDLQAGAALGFELHLVLTGKGRKTLAAGNLPPNTKVHDDLRTFALDFLAAHHD